MCTERYVESKNTVQASRGEKNTEDVYTDSGNVIVDLILNKMYNIVIKVFTRVAFRILLPCSGSTRYRT